jgi:hypothetical protein
MSNISSFMRCVGESESPRGARRAHSSVPVTHNGSCDLQYELHGRIHVARFRNYQQALTAATLAIFCELHDYGHVLICAATEPEHSQRFPNARTWRQAHA